MNTTFLGQCCNAKDCLQFDCKWFTPTPYTSETLPGPDWCTRMIGGEKRGKVVFVLPMHDIIPETEMELEKEGIMGE